MQYVCIDTALKQGGVLVVREEVTIHKLSKLTLEEYAAIIIENKLPIVAEAVQSFGFGKNAFAAKYEAKGRLEALAAAAGVSITWIYAQTWQAFYKISKKGMNDYQWKKLLTEKAKEINPKADKETADAILIHNFYKELISKSDQKNA